MIHRLISALIGKISNEFPAVKECRYYKGEFEPEGEWNPVFPVCLINCDSILPEKTSESKRVSVKTIVNLYIGIKMEVPEHTELLENLILYLNRLNDDEEINYDYWFMINTVSLVGYFTGVEAYKIELEVESYIV